MLFLLSVQYNSLFFLVARMVGNNIITLGPWRYIYLYNTYISHDESTMVDASTDSVHQNVVSSTSWIDAWQLECRCRVRSTQKQQRMRPPEAFIGCIYTYSSPVRMATFSWDFRHRRVSKIHLGSVLSISPPPGVARHSSKMAKTSQRQKNSDKKRLVMSTLQRTSQFSRR
jgi:hypothetical protein